MSAGLEHVVLYVDCSACVHSPIPWLDPLNAQKKCDTSPQSIYLHSPDLWQNIIRRQLLGKTLTCSQHVILFIGSRRISFTVRQVFPGAVSGTVSKHTVFSIRKDEVKEEARSLVPGYEHNVCSLTNDIHEYFSAKKRYAHMGISASQIAYIHGVPGVGKTTVINEALGRAHIPVIRGNMHEIIVSDGGSEPANAYIAASLKDLASRAEAAAVPVVIFLSNIDAIANSEIVQDTAELGNCFAEFLRRLPPNAFVVLESNVDSENMPGAVRRHDTKLHSHAVSMPRLSQRKEIVDHHMSNLWPRAMSEGGGTDSLHPTSQAVSSLSDRIANSTAGYVARDIAVLCRQAGLRRLRRLQQMSQHYSESESRLNDLFNIMSQLSLESSDARELPSWNDFAHSLAIVCPSQQIEFEGERPTKRWTDIGGYTSVIEKLKQSMMLATREGSTHRLGVNAPKGILLHGPSGCGKTAMALAMISESGCSVISIRSSELFSKYLGETEARLRRLFAAARAAAPCIVFIDEVDSLAARRGTRSEQIGGPELRILSTLLNEMDGIHGTSQVVVIGCTNAISQIDDAILRPGRFDQHIEVGLPDEADRAGILEILGCQSRLADNVDIVKLASSTEGFTGAALERLFREAGLSALRRNNGQEADVIEMRDFEISLSAM